jgi:hypothetical protein
MFAADTAGVVVEINDFGTRWERPTSGKQVRANRRNALKSTGPTGDEGKEVSSQNAVKGGFLSTLPRPILRGPFWEDEGEFYDRLEELVEAFNPRDAIERAVAKRLALVVINLERFDLYCAAAVEGHSRLTSADRRSGAEEHEVAIARVRAAHAVAGYLREEDITVYDVTWRDLAWLLRYRGPRPGVGVKRLWTDDTTPDTDEEWRKAFEALLEFLWSDTEKAIERAERKALRLFVESMESEQRHQEVAAMRILEEHSGLESRYHSRLVRDYQRLSAELRELQERNLDS